MLIFADGISVVNNSISVPKYTECAPYDCAYVLAWREGKVICVVKVFLPYDSGKLSFGGSDHAGKVGEKAETTCDVNADYHVQKLHVTCARDSYKDGRLSPFFSYEFREEPKGSLLFAVEIKTDEKLADLGFEAKAEMATA